jgi:hypothetical protein
MLAVAITRNRGVVVTAVVCEEILGDLDGTV